MATAKKAALHPKAPLKSPPLSIRIIRSQSHYYETKLPRQEEYRGKGLGVYFLLFEVIAGLDAIYIPLSIATGRKSAGFLYVTEGDGKGVPSVALVSEGGEGVTTVSSGSIVYVKIPQGRSARFRMNGEIIGTEGVGYRILLTVLSYKTNPNDFRYKKFLIDLGTELLSFTRKKK